MATKVTQNTVNPTPKLSAAVIVSGLMGIAQLIVQNLAPTWYDPSAWNAATTLFIGVVGYWVHDDANIVVQT